MGVLTQLKVVLIVMLTLFFCQSISSAQDMQSSYAPGRIIVKYRENTNSSKKRSIVNTRRGKKLRDISQINTETVEVPSDTSVEEYIKSFKEDPDVEFAEPDPVAYPDDTPVNDPYYPPSTTFSSGQWFLPAIKAPEAWATSFGSSDIIVAILDTGVYAQHADLADRIVAGWNTYDNSSDTADVYGHGTAVAGSAAASTNNGIGIASIAGNCRIMPMRISDKSGLGYGSTIASALTWAADHNARVANISYRMDFSATVTAAAKYFMQKGGVVTMSAGNEATNYASATDNPYILTVGATKSSTAIASFSNTGGNIDVVAPGSSIYTTNRSGAYSSWSGTSFSAPITAGVAALVYSVKPSLTGEEVRDIIKQSASDRGTAGYDTTFGYGLVNAADAVALALNQAPTLDTTAPTVSFASPTSGSTVSSVVSIKVTAMDNIQVSWVALYVDGVLARTLTQAPYNFTWDSTSAIDGAHSIKAVVSDLAGNTANKTISITTSNDTTAPTVSFTAPADGSSVSGSTTIAVSASDNKGIASIVVSVDGAAIGTLTSAPYNFTWDTTSVANGSHAIEAYALDNARNGSSALVNIVVDNDKVAPTATFISPAPGSEITGTTAIEVSASDDKGIASVVISIDDQPIGTFTQAPYTLSWNTTTTTVGSHILKATALDTSGNIFYESITIIVVAMVENITVPIDSDGDGVLDNDEISDGTDPLDKGSYLVTLQSPVYSKYNTYLNQQNYLELSSIGTARVIANVTLYNEAGTPLGKRYYRINPGRQVDIGIHDWVNKADAYGLIKISFNSTTEGVNLSGRMSVYREDPDASTIDPSQVSYSFAYARELGNALTGVTHAITNTIDMSGNHIPVDSWLELINLENVSKNFSIKIYNDVGKLIKASSVTVKPMGERDIAAGHQFGEGKFLVEITPTTTTAKYLATITRYSKLPSIDIARYNFASSMTARSGNGSKQLIPISRLSSSCWQQGNYLEFANTLNETVNVIVRIRNEAGKLVKKYTLQLKPHQANIINVSSFLELGKVGSVELTADKHASLLTQVSGYYFGQTDSEIQGAYSFAGLIPGQSIQNGSYNRYLNLDNLSYITNASGSATNVSVEVKLGTATIATKSYSLAPYASKMLNFSNSGVFTTSSNTYGTVVFSTGANNLVSIENLRVKEDQCRIDFSVPTAVR